MPEARWGRGRGREAGRGPGGSGLARQRPLFVPLLRPLQGQALGGPPREAGGVLAAGAPGSRPGPGTLLSGALEAPGGGGQGWRRGLKCPHPAPRGSPGGAAAALGGGLVPASMVPPFPLPQVASGACGPRGGNRGLEPLTRRERRWASRLREPVTGRGNFPKPEPEPEHPPPPPRPLIPLPLHLLRLLPLPPTRILLCLTDGAVSQ